MVRQDIVSALKNALERGYSVQQAKESLINAGYPINEVDVAANYLVSGMGINTAQVSQVSQQQQMYQSQPQQYQQPQQAQNSQAQPRYQQLPQTQQQPQYQQQYQQLPTISPDQGSEVPSSKKGPIIGIIILLIFLFILLVVLGIAIFFKDAMIEFLKGLFG